MPCLAERLACRPLAAMLAAQPSGVGEDGSLATADAPLAKAARAERVDVVALAGSDGKRP